MCWRVTACSSTSGCTFRMPSSSQCFTVRALSMVSAVVKVLDTTMARVVSGSRPCRARAVSTGSTFCQGRDMGD